MEYIKFLKVFQRLSSFIGQVKKLTRTINIVPSITQLKISYKYFPIGFLADKAGPRD